jgi:hypothetical protein
MHITPTRSPFAKRNKGIPNAEAMEKADELTPNVNKNTQDNAFREYHACQSYRIQVLVPCLEA